jgi:CheY-like chemotaxis protein
MLADRDIRGGAMILIVDDFQDGAEALCRLLRAAGYPCQWVGGGAEALALVRAHPPEQPLLLVLDDMMPGMSGVEVLRAIRADPKIAPTPVVLHSAGFDLEHRDEAMSLGALAWALKGAGGDVESFVAQVGRWYERAGGARQSNPGPTVAPPSGE